jgi:hypothetical protein
MEKHNNVIQFPSKNIRSTFPKDSEEIASNIKLVKFNHVNETLQTIIPLLFTNMELAGFQVAIDEGEEDFNIKDGALIVEAIRSLLCKIHDMEHPFQNLAESIFIQKDGVDELSMSEKINIDLYEKGDSF